MAGSFRRELKTAFFETGLLVAGGIAGGALAYWLFGGHWLINATGAVIGGSIVYHAGRFGWGSTRT